MQSSSYLTAAAEHTPMSILQSSEMKFPNYGFLMTMNTKQRSK
jgi:hypothetical protein